MFVAIDDDVSHLYLLLLVHINIEDDLVLVGDVVNLGYRYLGIVEAFVLEVFLGEGLRSVEHVWSYLAAFKQSEFRLHVFSFRFLHSRVVDYRHTRTGGKIEMQEYLVADDGVGGYGDL